MGADTRRGVGKLGCMRIAVIGAGVSGMVAARLLALRHEVTLLEAEPRPGGHAHTHDVLVDGVPVTVDTGFMVFNRRTYPNFCRLLEILGVESRASDMSFSFRCDAELIEYQGGSFSGLFSQWSNLARPAFWRMLSDIVRFNRQATEYAQCNDDTGETVGEFLHRGRYGRAMRDWYLRPMCAAIWSAPQSHIDRFPARFLLGFFANHGLLQLSDRPQWRTVVGGARSYVEALLAPISEGVCLGAPVTAVRRSEDCIQVTLGDEYQEYDTVVLACHADQALRLLQDADDRENRLLSAFPYQTNTAVLHTDPRPMPRSKRTWASWNYRAHGEAGADGPVTVTYDLTRLQGLRAPQDVFVTLNPEEPIDESRVLKRMEYAHPCYGAEAIAAQREHATLNGHRRTYYCGAYWGYGFHEDGVRSALAVAECFGLSLDDLRHEPAAQSTTTAAGV